MAMYRDCKLASPIYLKYQFFDKMRIAHQLNQGGQDYNR